MYTHTRRIVAAPEVGQTQQQHRHRHHHRHRQHSMRTRLRSEFVPQPPHPATPPFPTQRPRAAGTGTTAAQCGKCWPLITEGRGANWNLWPSLKHSRSRAHGEILIFKYYCRGILFYNFKYFVNKSSNNLLDK